MRAWKGFEPVWLGARAALDREIERIGVATALDAQLELLDGLLVRGSVHEARWCVRCPMYGGRVRFPESGVPGGRRGWFDPRTRGDVLASVSYPVRSPLAHGTAAPPAGALEGLLSIPRAQILRAIGRPMSIGDLAGQLRAVPSAATHHVGALEAADLVERYRRGRKRARPPHATRPARLEIYHGRPGAHERVRPDHAARPSPAVLIRLRCGARG